MSVSIINEGIFAVNKPKSISSAQVLRELQQRFNPSKFFAPWLAAERANRSQATKKEQRKRRRKDIQVKLGHGGTLDPMATGVLIVGVGRGTKRLQDFLGCTKSYEATVLFGAATDSYDTLGRVLNKAPYAHITQEKVEKALGGFRGKIMQRPPLYSAIHVQGKRLYEYAREGKEVPVEIQERPVEVKELSIVEWLEGGSHEYKWPIQEAEKEDKEVAEKVLHLQEVTGTSTEEEPSQAINGGSSKKRKRLIDGDDDFVATNVSMSKRQETSEELCMSGGLQDPDQSETVKIQPGQMALQDAETESQAPSFLEERPPVVKLRMTVTSGFYVRSLAHDLGKAVGSLACMSDLVRSRQEQFILGQNVLEWSDVERGEEIWNPKLEAMLRDWQSRTVSTSKDEHQSHDHDAKDSAPNISVAIG